MALNLMALDFLTDTRIYVLYHARARIESRSLLASSSFFYRIFTRASKLASRCILIESNRHPLML